MTKRTPVPEGDRKRKKAKATAETPEKWLDCIPKDQVAAVNARFKQYLSANALSSQNGVGCWHTKLVPGNHLTENKKDGCRGVFTAAPWLKKQGYETKFKNVVSTARAVADLHNGGCLSKDQQASHLCHNPRCIRPSHIVIEDANKNRSRNFCDPARHCAHTPKCIAAGPRAADVLLPGASISDE